MNSNIKVSMTVNGRPVSGEVDPRTLLVEFIRDHLRLTGTHVGCDTSQCGACTVHLDGISVKSCSVFAAHASGREVITIEQNTPTRDAYGAAIANWVSFAADIPAAAQPIEATVIRRPLGRSDADLGTVPTANGQAPERLFDDDLFDRRRRPVREADLGLLGARGAKEAERDHERSAQVAPHRTTSGSANTPRRKSASW